MDRLENRLETFIKRMDKLGVKIKITSNYPWVYITSINGTVVYDKYQSEWGFVLCYMPIRIGEEIKFVELEKIFKLIRKYI